MEPLCEEILTRKRQMEQDFRNKFNNWNCLQAVGEDLLMEKLAIELEMDEICETIFLDRMLTGREAKLATFDNNRWSKFWQIGTFVDNDDDNDVWPSQE